MGKKVKKNHKINTGKMNKPVVEEKPVEKPKTIEYNLNGQIFRSSNISTSMDSLFDIVKISEVDTYLNNIEQNLSKMQNKIESRINDILKNII